MNIQTVGVIGAGVMGSGVAQNLAQTNHRVILVDISEDILEKARGEIAKNIRFQRLFGKTGASGEPDEILKQIIFTTDYSRLGDAGFVIENVTEKWELKKGGLRSD